MTRDVVLVTQLEPQTLPYGWSTWTGWTPKRNLGSRSFSVLSPSLPCPLLVSSSSSFDWSNEAGGSKWYGSIESSWLFTFTSFSHVEQPLRFVTSPVFRLHFGSRILLAFETRANGGKFKAQKPSLQVKNPFDCGFRGLKHKPAISKIGEKTVVRSSKAVNKTAYVLYVDLKRFCTPKQPFQVL